MKHLSIILALFAATAVSAQEQLYDLTCNPVLTTYYHDHPAVRRQHAPAPGDTLLLPFHDDFSYTGFIPDTARWDDVYAWVYVNRGFPIAPPNAGVATFDGLNAIGYPYDFTVSVTSSGKADYLTSKPFYLNNYQASDSVYLSFYYQPEGRGNAPEAVDSLILEFFSPLWGNEASDTAWHMQWYAEGFNPSSSDSTFYHVMLRLSDPDLFQAGFRFRFRNKASRCGSLDHWHVDEVYLNENRNMNDKITKEVRFTYHPQSMLKDWSAMPHWLYKPTKMTDTIHNFIRNNDTLDHAVTAYSYVMRDRNGVLIVPSNTYSTSGGPLMDPFDTSGYYTYGPMVDPPVANITNFGLSSFIDSTFCTTTHYLTSDIPGQSDSIVYQQNFYDYFAYDDGSAEAGYGVNQMFAKVALQYVHPSGENDSLKAFQIFFNPVGTDIRNDSITLMVWNDNNGQPGTIIYQEGLLNPVYMQQGYNRFATYVLANPLNISGTYYIGWQQTTVRLLNVGLDLNTDRSDKLFYNFNGTWYNSAYKGALMMRPVFDELYGVSGVQEHAAAGQWNVYPNPAQYELNISGKGTVKQAIIYDIAGREVLQVSSVNNGSINISSLQAGSYFIRIADTNGQAETVRFVVAR